ncbi:Uncharacterized protein OS=Rhodanobacter thiooxydans LCS2 GN=UUA_13265 PE=4 SV=1: DUF4339 [Gemmata massiliana]|uniref:GYF domain-containing protein n=1 Tax=Gemmata massiliana TaxID=1210884 RepID=A0A6P2D4H7_9BACT|nr:DUF4339 domain-containing protein [Gemmata massiliana]VTR94320.1 Uncharacterized protein OS=Rhodanobacter thiooxydans LCS2 GN=UUA_13265 PE=4 SV=1: DUF4339 [Gemmata massiliana]
MANVWYYTRNGGAPTGPVTSQELAELARTDRLGPTDSVWKEGMAEWQPAARVKGLFPAVTPGTPQPPLAPLSPAPVLPEPGGSFDFAEPTPPVRGGGGAPEQAPNAADEFEPSSPSGPKSSRRVLILGGVAGGTLLLTCVACGVIGAVVGRNNPTDAGKKGTGLADVDMRAEFNPKNLNDTLAWVRTIQGRVKGLDNPLVLKEAVARESKAFERVNGTRVEWLFPVTALYGGDTPVVEFDGQKMRFGDGIAVLFSGGRDGGFTGRVYLGVGEHVPRDRYKVLKAGAPAAVKGTVRLRFAGDTAHVDIFVDGANMN